MASEHPLAPSGPPGTPSTAGVVPRSRHPAADSRPRSAGDAPDLLAGYFDGNGSTPLDPRVRAEVERVEREVIGNAAAPHPAGRAAREVIAAARRRAAASIGARPEEILFTSGGTEANNHALFGRAAAAGGGHLVVSAIEHKSVLAPARALEVRGTRVTRLLPDGGGRVAPEAIEAALAEDTFLVSLMLANNETGVLQAVREVGRITRERGVVLHVDAVAAIGKVPVDVGELGCDLLSLSAHKLYAPKGVGLLYVREGTALEPWILGCGQQGGRRSGTENTAGVAGFAAALECFAGAEGAAEIGALRDALWEGIAERCPDAQRNGAEPLLANTLNVWFPGVAAAALQAELGARGYSVAAGAASGTGRPSHVLTAMGHPEQRARESLRFSLCHGTTRAAVDGLLEALGEALEAARRLSGGAA